jgi:capsular exopolysaccharide synthesis family protein
MRFVTLPSGEVEIRAVAWEPRIAMDLSNTYVGVLQARSRSHLRSEARATRQFIENFITQTKHALQEAEESAAKLGRGRGGLRSPERFGLEMAQLTQLESSLADVQASRQIATMRLAALKGTSVAEPPASRARGERLVALEAKLANLQERYTDQHPLVRATQAEIRDLSAAALDAGPRGRSIPLSAADQTAASKHVAELDLEIASLQAREELTRQRIARLSANLSSLGGEDTETAKALRRVETQRNLLSTLSEKLGTAAVQEQGDDRGLRVIDLATLPAGPTAAPAKKMIFLGVLLGMAVGVGVASVIEYFNHPIETEEDILNAVNASVLGWLPTVAGARASTNGHHTALSFVDGAIPDTLPVEGCRSIRTALETLHGPHELRTVMLASAGPSEGKSTITLNLGWVFWELGRRLVLIDADLRRPTLHEALARPSKPGLADLLSGRAGWPQTAQSIRDGFVLIPAGSAEATGHTKPGVLLTAERLRPFLDDAKGKGDMVFFDSAPVLAVVDNLILASLVDGVVLVVRAGHTQRRDLVRAKDAIEKAGGRILGVVLNQLSRRDTRRYYSRYGAYYNSRQEIDSRPWWRRYPPWHSGEKDVA